MIQITAEPLTISQMVELSETNDAVITLGKFRCKYLMAAEGQIIEVPHVYCDPKTNLLFGLRPVSKPNSRYDYIAFRIY